MRTTHDLSHVPVAVSFWRRLVGLIGQRDPARLFLLIPRCASIHTCFVSSIDVVFLDGDSVITKIRESVLPWSVAVGPRGTKSVLELPPGHASKLGLKVGDLANFNK